MPVGAFDQEGRLKKHALLGTSFASDPNRAKKRGQYQDLYKEAVPIAGEGREAMVEKLSGRFQEFAAPQQSRLGEIAAEKSGFEAQAAGLGSDAQEERNRMYSDFTTRGGFDASYLRDYGNYGMPTDLLGQVRDDYNAMSWNERRDYAITNRDDLFWEGYDREEIGARGGADSEKIGPGLPDKTNPSLWMQDVLQAEGLTPMAGGPETDAAGHPSYYEERTAGAYSGDLSRENDFSQGVAGHMARTRFEEQYGQGQQESYESKIMQEVDKINESYIPLQEEEAARNKRLQDRMELYNMFLGG